MELKQLLCPKVLGWIAEHDHIEDDGTLFKEYEKWFSENEEEINESVENNLEKINEYIEKGKTLSKKSILLSEAITFDDEEDEDMDEDDDSGEDDYESGEDEYESDDVEVSSGVSFDDDDDEDEILPKKIDKSYVTAETMPLDDVEDEELKEKIHDKAASLSEKMIIHLTNDNLYDAINAAFIAIEEENKLNKKNTALWSSFDTSGVTDMTALFAFTYMPKANLSHWDVSKVKTMEGMFYRANFNNDSICEWDVSSCTIFDNMFMHSNFNQDITLWDPGTIYVVDKYGSPVIDPKTGKQMTRKAALPFIGASKDEKAERTERTWVNKYKEILASSTSESVKYNNKHMKHILDYNTFINEGFGDFVNKGISKVAKGIKSFFKNIAMKFGDFIEIFDNKGKLIEATSPYTSLNLISNGDIKGVSAFTKVKNECLNGNVQSVASIEESPEYYGILDKNSIEYKNFLTMVETINEHCSKHNEDFNKLNESGEYGYDDDGERIGFTSKAGGLKGIPDIDSKKLIRELKYIMKNVPGNERKSHTLCVWGAPGIGKSTIPKAVINAWNKSNPDALKSIMVVECANLTVDGFSLPMPIKKKLSKYLEEHPLISKKLETMDDKKYQSKLKDEDFLNKLFQVSDDAPKTWLPAYRLSADEDENKIRNSIANGHLVAGYDENGHFKVKETTEGGIIILDEFLRANPHVFNILMQIILNREFEGYRLGDQWGILCCSNRPEDDPSINDKLKDLPPVGFNRFQQMNFIPSFDEWKEWAVRDGGFDPITIAFLQSDVDPKTKEYVNWHTVIPEEYKGGYTAWPTPRTWTMAMEKINNIKADYGEIDDDWLRDTLGGFIGLDMAEKYMKFLKSRRKSLESFDVMKFLSVPKYFPTEISYEEDGDIKKRKLLCYEITDLLGEHICSAYSKNNLPSNDNMVLCFDKLENKFGTTHSVQKYLNSFYIKLLTDFTGLNKKMDFKEFKTNFLKVNYVMPSFIEKIVNKYNFYNDPTTKIASLKKIYQWLAPWVIQ
jgi:hypothetical protein